MLTVIPRIGCPDHHAREHCRDRVRKIAPPLIDSMEYRFFISPEIVKSKAFPRGSRKACCAGRPHRRRGRGKTHVLQAGHGGRSG